MHLPKTAGTSFAAALEEKFRDRLIRDYSDYPINTPQYDRNKAALQASLNNAEKDFQGVECIHGHFLPLKYLLLSNKQKVTFITWMRNPVERILSHYYYWKKSFDPETALPLHKKMIEERWSLERFCLGPELKNIYCQFLYGFPIEYFSFIGVTEFYSEDFAYFTQHFLGYVIEPKKLNIGDKKGQYQIDETLRQEIERVHSEDFNLYQKALEKRGKT